ncbi:hypothetical protein ODU73_000355 [Thermoclostridium stercorarium]|nr:hypothetical protein [Thermoclostridium stercorarium]UZQ85968.1 hypothetical protein ODU73_000355 [Thermoclostridium stercorarium]
MILIGRNIVTEDRLTAMFGQDETKYQIADMMLKAGTVFTYKDEQLFDFEVKTRKEIVRASERLNNSFFSFRLFKDSVCNKRYWDRTEEGGFRLKKTSAHMTQ